MDCDFPSIYRSAYEDAERRDELKEYAKSFRLNVGCACAIELDIRACAIGNGLQAGCVDMTLERYGFQRVSFVLANSLCKMEHPESIREDVIAWGEQIYVPPDGDNNRYYAVDAATPLLEAFIGQVRETYQTLGLFGPEHCVNSEKGLDYTNVIKLVVQGRSIGYARIFKERIGKNFQRLSSKNRRRELRQKKIRENSQRAEV